MYDAEEHYELRLTADEMDTVRGLVQFSWRFEPDDRLIREVLERGLRQITLRGCRQFGWLTPGVPDQVLNDFSYKLIGERVPETLPTYEAWQAWKERVAEAHADWVRKKDAEGNASE